MTLILPDKLPYHFERVHIPTGRIWLGEFNAAHSEAFRDNSWPTCSLRTLFYEMNRVVAAWNRQQPNTWRYTALAGPCPATERAPDGTFV